MSKVMPSVWEKTERFAPFPRLFGSVEVDVAIVGAGITGCTLAYLLTKAGVKVALIERQEIASGTTGQTSAHLCSQWDMGFHKVISHHDKETARMLYSGLNESIDFIEEHSTEKARFHRLNGYLCATEEDQLSALDKEINALSEIGIPFEKMDSSHLPGNALKGIKVSNQASFHPLGYMASILDYLKDEGVEIYENSPVVKLGSNSVRTHDGKVKAEHIVEATHTPIGFNLLQSALTPYRSYVIAGPSSLKHDDMLFWDLESPYHYVRKTQAGGKELLVIGGSDKKPGVGSENKTLNDLKEYAKEVWDVQETVYEWSSQVYEPSDALPIIGKLPGISNTYVATGFSGDGLTSGTLAGRVISEMILGRESDEHKVFSPMRFSFLNKDFFQHNKEVAKRIFSPREEKTADPFVLAPGEGAVDTSGSEALAYYRKESGELNCFSATCPHMKCTVHWNEAQRSFDCPCHGSRFNGTGDVLEGPALEGLEPRQLD